MTISRFRRCTLAAASCAIAWVMLHSFIAQALCMRGDEFLHSGDPLTAVRYYARAASIDPECGKAVDRLAFSSLEIRTPRILAYGIDLANKYLARHPADAPVRTDRALALLAAGHNASAAVELQRIAIATSDARFAALAKVAAHRATGSWKP